MRRLRRVGDVRRGDRQCVLNAGTRFDLVAVDGSVPGDNWDPFFGPPDPYICASDGVMEQCSSIQSDDATPKWNDTLLTGLDGEALLTTALAFDYEESDLDTPDPCAAAASRCRRRICTQAGSRSAATTARTRDSRCATPTAARPRNI